MSSPITETESAPGSQFLQANRGHAQLQSSVSRGIVSNKAIIPLPV